MSDSIFKKISYPVALREKQDFIHNKEKNYYIFDSKNNNLLFTKDKELGTHLANCINAKKPNKDEQES